MLNLQQQQQQQRLSRQTEKFPIKRQKVANVEKYEAETNAGVCSDISVSRLPWEGQSEWLLVRVHLCFQQSVPPRTEKRTTMVATLTGSWKRPASI